MSTEQDQVRAMAERIARRMSQGRDVDDGGTRRAEGKGDVGDELAAMRESLEELKQRLVQIETHVPNRADAPQRERAAHDHEQGDTARQSYSPANGVRSPWLSGMYV